MFKIFLILIIFPSIVLGEDYIMSNNVAYDSIALSTWNDRSCIDSCLPKCGEGYKTFLSYEENNNVFKIIRECVPENCTSWITNQYGEVRCTNTNYNIPNPTPTP